MAKDPCDGLLPQGVKPTLNVWVGEGENAGRVLARVMLDPQARNANLAMAFGSPLFGDKQRPDLEQATAALADEVRGAIGGDLSISSRILASHAVVLDTIFTEMARRSGANLGQYPEAAERYMRLALKAQASCRSTLEALGRLHQPREQTVRHVHVNEGGQAVIADQFHHYTGGQEFEKSVKQSHATRKASQSAALPCQNASRNGLPIPGSKRETSMQDARRDESGGS